MVDDEVDDAVDFGLDLLRQAKNMRVVLGKTDARE